MINATGDIAFFKLLGSDELLRQLASVTVASRSWGDDFALRRTIRAAAWFGDFFVSEQLSVPLDEDFVRAVFEFASLEPNSSRASEPVKRICSHFVGTGPAAESFQYLRRGCKLFLFSLWKTGFVGLPLRFNFQKIGLPEVENEILKFINGFSSQSTDTQVQKKSWSRQIYYYMPRVLYATNWSDITSLDLVEFADLHHFSQKSRLTGDAIVSASPIPWTAFINAFAEKFGDAVSFSQKEVKDYLHYVTSHAVSQEPFSAYCERLGARKKRTVRQEKTLHISTSPRVSKKLLLDKICVNQGDTQEDRHKSALAYISQLRGASRKGLAHDWRQGAPTYPGREHINTEKLGEVWLAYIDDFFHHRHVHERKEKDNDHIYSLNSLVDYLLLYLPWYYEIYPETKISFPLRPLDFTRFPFVLQSTAQLRSNFPISLFDFIDEVRKTPGSTAAARRQLRDFFKFLEKYTTDDKPVGADFESPISEDDIPSGTHPSKTNKPIFPQPAIPYLTLYAYACEAFGMFLEEATIDGRIVNANELPRVGAFEHYDTGSCGYVPLGLKDGKFHPFHQVPNLFSFSERIFYHNFPSQRKILQRTLPHLSTLRLCIAGIENGLRFQSLQWLDINEWDSYNAEFEESDAFSYFPTSALTFELHLSVDKTQEEWETIMFFSVRAMLQREVKFQRACSADNGLVPVRYENRESRFGPITPLFRSSTKSTPVSDTTYATAWEKLMTGFQLFYPTALGHEHYKLIRFSVPSTPNDSKCDYLIDQNFGSLAFSRLTYRAVCTPHSCRSTFATHHRKSMGPDEIAECLGQKTARLARYYFNPTREDLHEKVAHAHAEMYAGMWFMSEDLATGNYTVAEPEYVRADKPDSVLRRAMRANRAGAVEDFGFMPALILWSLSKGSSLWDEGKRQLLAAPMYRLHFLDTHICPVAEECPEEVIKAVGERHRCGLCPIAMKCVDHLPAHAAKLRTQASRITFLNSKRKMMVSAGEPPEAYARLTDEINLEMAEFDGWYKSEAILLKIRDKLAEQHGTGQRHFYTEQPELLRPHLRLVEKELDSLELSAQRIFDAAAYPSMSDDDVQLRASIIRRKLMAGKTIGELGLSEAAPDVVVAAHALRLELSTSRKHIIEVRAVLLEVLGASV